MENYVQFRVSDGEWVCGQHKEHDEESVTVSDVRSIDLVPLEDEGRYGVVFIPYTVTDPDVDVKFYRQHIVSEVQGIGGKMYGVYVEHMKLWEDAEKEMEEAEKPSNILSLVTPKGNDDA